MKTIRSYKTKIAIIYNHLVDTYQVYQTIILVNTSEMIVLKKEI
jgi:hypothetical protein